MSVMEIFDNRSAFSFEVFPPKTDAGMEKFKADYTKVFGNE